MATGGLEGTAGTTEPGAGRNTRLVGAAQRQVDVVALADRSHAGDAHPRRLCEVHARPDGAGGGRLEVPLCGRVVHQPADVGVAVPQAEHCGQPGCVDRQVCRIA